jgi:hypothetical protein
VPYSCEVGSGRSGVGSGVGGGFRSGVGGWFRSEVRSGVGSGVGGGLRSGPRCCSCGECRFSESAGRVVGEV